LARLAYSILFVADLECSIRFYRDTIGLPLRFARDTYAEFATEGRSSASIPARIFPS
jgi:catechol 2,3-dioxygenase-like lactoylglutathione lyase family enzyme